MDNPATKILRADFALILGQGKKILRIDKRHDKAWFRYRKQEGYSSNFIVKA